MDDTCATCRFFLPRFTDQGICRLHAPTLRLQQCSTPVAEFPPMPVTGWCGEFKEKDDHK